MKKELLLIFILLVQEADALLINQVLYDPLKTESGGEAIELINNDSFDVDASEYFITTERSEKDIVLPNKTIIKAGEKFLITDSGWNTSKDINFWKNADFEATMTLNNHDSGIILKDKRNKTIDFISWGSKEEIPQKFLISEPAEEVKEGNALLRKSSTGNNHIDFTESAPEFFDKNTITIELNISEEENIEVLEDDSVNEGTQIIPSPGRDREITVKTSSPKIKFREEEINAEKEEGVYAAKIKIPHYLTPGNYTIKTEKLSKTIEVLELKSFELETKAINIVLFPGKENTAEINIKNNGNTQISVILEGSELTYENTTLPATIWSQTKAFIDVNEEEKIKIKLNIPENTSKGTYKGILRVKIE